METESVKYNFEAKRVNSYTYDLKLIISESITEDKVLKISFNKDDIQNELLTCLL